MQSWGASISASAVYVALTRAAELLEHDPGEAVAELLDTAQAQNSYIVGQGTLPFLSLFDGREYDYYRVQQKRLLLTSWYVKKRRGDAYWGKKYDELFDGLPSMTFADIERKQFSGVEHQVGFYDDEVIQRIDSFAILKSQFLSLAQYYNRESQRMLQIANDSSLPRPNLPGREVPNAWRNFLGTYEVNATDCVRQETDESSLDPITSFTVLPGPASHPERLGLCRSTASGSRICKDLYDGGFDADQLIKVFGDSQQATRFSESGNRWSERWSHRTAQLSRTVDGFILVEAHHSRRWRYDEIMSQGGTCTYRLSRAVE